MFTKKNLLFADNEETNNLSCYFCNGFYAPNNGRLVCVVCHTFLCQEAGLEVPISFTNLQNHPEESDDDDSGNDEPLEYRSADGRDNSESELNREAPPEPDNDPLSTNRINEQVQLLDLINTLSNFSNPLAGDNATSIICLPPEVLLTVFSYLDEFSLWSAASVCQQWRSLIKDEISQNQWKIFVQKQWPLFKPLVVIQDWFQAYTSLINSSSCISCVQQMSSNKFHSHQKLWLKLNNHNSWRNNRLGSEIKLMVSDPLEGIFVQPLDALWCYWQAAITGPVGSPYEGGKFFLYMEVPINYPMKPPQVRFITKIFHPNISRHGDVGIDSINHNWSLALTISKVLISIQSLLTDPYCEISMEPEIARLYKENRPLFEKTARLWTWKYAMTEFML